MRTPLLLAALSLVSSFGHHPTQGASITYKLQDYAPQENSYSLGGTITTDGTIGIITAADISAWQFTLFYAGSILDKESGSFLTSKYQSGTYLTTSTGLFEITKPTGGTLNELTLSPSAGVPEVAWYRDPGGSDEYLATSGSPQQSYGWATGGSPLLLGGSATWVIGQATPEPSSLTQALLGIACLAVVLWMRRGRRVATSPQPSPSAPL